MRLGRGVRDIVKVRFPLGGGEAEVMEMRRLTEGKGKERVREMSFNFWRACIILIITIGMRRAS